MHIYRTMKILLNVNSFSVKQVLIVSLFVLQILFLKIERTENIKLKDMLGEHLFYMHCKAQ